MKVAYGIEMEQTGIAYGFTVANQKTREALISAGVEIDNNAPIVVHFCSPILYRPWPGRVNVCYTVYEAPELPDPFQEAFDHPDTTAIAAPSTFCRQIFQKYTRKPVYYCPHGIDVDVFSYKERRWSNLGPRMEPFVFLYCGALTPRKGFDFIYEFWSQHKMWQHSQFRLIFKITLPDEGLVEKFLHPDIKVLRKELGGCLLQEGNVFIDSRNLPVEDLCRLYHRAHCLLFLSRGEGFGQTAAEAAATGLPIIATNYSGHLDFLDSETAYLVKYTLGKLPTMSGREQTGHEQTMAFPDPGDFMWQLRNVVDNYQRALLRGKRAAERIRRDFTWPQVGQKLKAILQEVANSDY